MQTNTATTTKHIVYDDGTTRAFIWFSIGWGLIGMLVGLLCALQLSFPSLNGGIPWLTFSRIRPLHTNAVIFALVGNMMFAGVYYSTQRLLKARMASDLLSKVHLWGWQLIILGAALTLPFGITQSKEYAELEWFLDIGVVLVWVAFAVNFFWTMAIRNEKNLYVAIWFYISTILTIAVLYIVNNLAIPVTWDKSYGIFAGAQDALTQWWYGHNAVAFFLTTPILGIMYYFLPKAAERPVFSYRLSIVHFWALVFIYIWAGPHHLLNTALPDWAQSLGMLFSVMLWAPSWGGMLNGLLTLRGAWNRVRTDPVLKFLVAGVTFYGMSTFEGPLMSIKAVSGLSHYTDWIIGHVHGGALGWNGFMAAGMFYWLLPRLFGTRLWSTKLADMHFWIGTVGILLYMASMWVAGITEGLMWRAMTPAGDLQYQNWGEIISVVQPMYYTRSVGGLLFITGWLMLIVNAVKTALSGKAVNGEADVTVEVVTPAEAAALPGTMALLFSKPVIMSAIGLAAAVLFALDNQMLAPVGLVLLLGVVAAAGLQLFRSTAQGKHTWHENAERRPLAFTVLVLVAVLAGGIIELVPGLVIDQKVPVYLKGDNLAMCVEPYTALELTGRDIYVSDGCYLCHSQMIRPFREEALRYGDPSRIEESAWDHPFQWGSKRTGPDLARIGSGGQNTKPSAWHWDHMRDPKSVTADSIMPPFPWLYEATCDPAAAIDKMKVLRMVGVPYTDAQIENAQADYERQAAAVLDAIAEAGTFGTDPTRKAEAKQKYKNREIVALIAYLDRLGHNQIPGGRTASVEDLMDREVPGAK